MDGKKIEVKKNSKKVGYIIKLRKKMRNIEKRKEIGQNIKDEFKKGLSIERSERRSRIIEDKEEMRKKKKK